jgi:hypothetical protein
VKEEEEEEEGTITSPERLGARSHAAPMVIAVHTIVLLLLVTDYLRPQDMT